MQLSLNIPHESVTAKEEEWVGLDVTVSCYVLGLHLGAAWFSAGCGLRAYCACARASATSTRARGASSLSPELESQLEQLE